MLYEYLKNAKKVYLIERKKVLSWKLMLLFLLSSYSGGENLAFTNFLAEFEDKWEIIVTYNGRVVEIIKLEEDFELSDDFVFKKYKYKVQNDITSKLYKYIKYL